MSTTYRTTHTTTYLYDQSVAQSISEARLTPRSAERQRVLEAQIAVKPDFATMEARTDYFCNQVTMIAVFGTHEQFVVTSTSVVEVGIGPARELPVIAWETVRDQL